MTFQRVGIGVFVCRNEAKAPEYSTKYAACFDLRAYLKAGTTVKIWSSGGSHDFILASDGLVVLPEHRYLIPTGLIFNIPDEFSMRVHPRSGMALKGINLVNCEGVIDSDYHKELFIPINNIDDKPIFLQHEDRIAQAEVVRLVQAEFSMESSVRVSDSNRDGGFGSTGLK